MICEKGRQYVTHEVQLLHIIHTADRSLGQKSQSLWWLSGVTDCWSSVIFWTYIKVINMSVICPCISTAYAIFSHHCKAVYVWMECIATLWHTSYLVSLTRWVGGGVTDDVCSRLVRYDTDSTAPGWCAIDWPGAVTARFIRSRALRNCSAQKSTYKSVFPFP
jgi:hypothetical protein